jgi:hypothetical protein
LNSPAPFTVTLHHLSPDVKRAGLEFPDQELISVTPEKLRALLEALAVLAPKTEPPAEPELRIAGPHGRFLVQGRNKQVKVISWSTQGGGSGLSSERILAMIMGMEQEEGSPNRGRRKTDADGGSRRWKIALLAVVVLGSNAVTAWMLTRPPPPPPPEILAEHKFVAPERGERILGQFAGNYETGTGDGDRRLTVGKDGAVRWTRLGPNQTVTEDFALTAKAAESRGQPVLVASNFGMIEMKDPITVVYFGDSYRRKIP